MKLALYCVHIFGPETNKEVVNIQRFVDARRKNLDNAVNGKINNFTLNQDSSGSTDYSPPPKKNNYTPPKPPRKAPSSSPPNIRRGYVSFTANSGNICNNVSGVNRNGLVVIRFP